MVAVFLDLGIMVKLKDTIYTLIYLHFYMIIEINIFGALPQVVKWSFKGGKEDTQGNGH